VPERVQTLVQLTRELVTELDARALKRGMSRSELIRELLDAGLREGRADEASRRMLDGYRRWPQADGSDAWGDLARWSAANARHNLAALDEEEPTRW
jgi:hypothetical protein